MKKVLILGAKGMLGQILTKDFNAAGFEVIAWDKEELDITDNNQVREKITNLRPKIVINAAAYNNVDKAEAEDRGIAFQINGEAVGYLAVACQTLNTIFVHYSTGFVFAGLQTEGYVEADTPVPINIYGLSKLTGEKKVLTTPNLKYYLIRTSHLFGPAGEALESKKSFVDKMLSLAKEKTELNLVNEERFSPTYTLDLSKATLDLISGDFPWGIYHRTNNGSGTWYEWGKKIFELAKIKIKVNPITSIDLVRAAKRPACTILKTTKLPPLRDWQVALEEYLSNFLNK